MDDRSLPKLRRSWLSGYRVADVEVLRARLELTITHLTQALEASRARLAESEAERERLVADAARAASTREEAVVRTQSRAEELVEAARLDAARIRAAAALEEQEVRAQVEELVRLRDTLATTIRTVTHDFERAMGGIEERAPEPAPDPTPEPIPPPTPPPPPPPAAARRPARTVELEAGPFRDFASLSAFEDALGTLSKVEDVYVRRFEGDRATIEVTLGEEPAALLDEMAARLPYTLSVDRADADRIAVHVVGE